MSKSVFTAEQLAALRNNPYVESATSRRITYTTEFKKRFIEEYRKGKRPGRIFSEAGFDVNTLGNKRIERASDRWRREYNEGRLGETVDYVGVHREQRHTQSELRIRLMEQEELINELRDENVRLREQLTRLGENGDRTMVRE